MRKYLRYAFEILSHYCTGIGRMLLVGGGAKSPFWRQMFADVFGIEILKTGIDQNAASLGAAALAAKGLGWWKDYSLIDEIHVEQSVEKPDEKMHEEYGRYYELSRFVAHRMAECGDEIACKLK